MCHLIKAKPEEPLVTLGKNKWITYKSFQNYLRNLSDKLGLDSQLFSSHSFRRGGATFAFESGVPSELIQLHGDWKSDAYKKYLSFSLKDKVLVAKMMIKHSLEEIKGDK